MSSMSDTPNCRPCERCGQDTYEDEFYGCDCEPDTECDECGESKEGGPYKACTEHYHKDIREVQATIFDELLASRNKLQKQLDELQPALNELKKMIKTARRLLNYDTD